MIKIMYKMASIYSSFRQYIVSVTYSYAMVYVRQCAEHNAFTVNFHCGPFSTATDQLIALNTEWQGRAMTICAQLFSLCLVDTSNL